MELSLNFNQLLGILPDRKNMFPPQLSRPAEKTTPAPLENDTRRTRQDSNLMAFYKAMDLAG